MKHSENQKTNGEHIPDFGDIRIVSPRRHLREGLFGQVLLFVFEVLPALHRAGCFPDWDIRSANYGEKHRVIPGVFELAYQVDPIPRRKITLRKMRKAYCEALGHDWPRVSELWHTYFRIPERVVSVADQLGPLDNVLGVHFRGNDKAVSSWDTNPVTHQDLMKIIVDCLQEHPEYTKIFLATDEYACVDFIQGHVDIEIINLGRVDFHKAYTSSSELSGKADRAVLDSLLLSRCEQVLQCCSALSAFSKVLNPDLEIYRYAASKRFADIPYFPSAYIPRYQAHTPDVAKLMDRLMDDDWMDGDDTEAYLSPFTSLPRQSVAG